MSEKFTWEPGAACRLDGEAAEIIAVRGRWVWVAKDGAPNDPEAVDAILLEPFATRARGETP